MTVTSLQKLVFTPIYIRLEDLKMNVMKNDLKRKNHRLIGYWTRHLKIILLVTASFCTTVHVLAQNSIQSSSIASKKFGKDVYLFCDFKSEYTKFYEFKKGELIEITETGFAKIASPALRFSGKKLIRMGGGLYVYGGIEGFSNDEQQVLAKISPMPDSYVKRDDLICFDMREIFPQKFFLIGAKK
jgi:hypothetical protein